MGKLTEETINKIKCLRSEGKKILEIAKCLEISGSTVSYYSTPSYKSKHIKRVVTKIKCLPLEKQREIRNKSREYQCLYHKKKYQEDPLFREKQIVASIKYNQKALKNNKKALEIKKKLIKIPKRKFRNPFIRRRK